MNTGLLLYILFNQISSTRWEGLIFLPLFFGKMKFKAIILTTILFSFNHENSLSQNDTVKGSSYVFQFIPSGKKNIYGLAFGLVGSETICNIVGTKKSHGINLQIIGQGFFIPLNRKAFGYKSTLQGDSSWMVKSKNPSDYKAIHNGLLLSSFGTLTDKTNGIVLSSWCSLGYEMNGITINLISSKYVSLNGLSISINNEANSVKGVQVGIINRTSRLKGFQIGIWNVNDKRKLPLINWSFSH